MSETSPTAESGADDWPRGEDIREGGRWRCRLFGHRPRAYMGCECRRCGAWWVFDHWTKARITPPAV